MTFQFKPRARDSPHEECEKEMTLLRDYNKALEKENESRNEQRKALQAEIERLLRHEREWKERGGMGKSVVVVTSESREYVQLKEQYAELKSKYEGLLIENSALTSRIITQDYSSRASSFEGERNKLNDAIRAHEAKITALQAKLLASERELSEARSRQESSSSTITRQYQQSITTIDDLEKQLRAKNELIARLQAEALTKEEQTKALQRSVDGYSLKIDALSDELARLERTHKVETVRIVEREDPTLRSRLDQFASLNAALTADNVALRGQAEFTRELQRRAALLEESNQRLQAELRTAIEARGSASRVQLQEDRNLKEAVLALKAELQEVRSFNQLARQENEELHAQLQLLKTTSHGHSHSRCQRCKHSHKSRSRSPLRHEERPVRSALGETYSALQHPVRSHTSQCNISGSHSHAHFHALQEGRSQLSSQGSTLKPSSSSQAVNERYNNLQRKIQMLQSENQVLKQKLVYEI